MLRRFLLALWTALGLVLGSCASAGDGPSGPPLTYYVSPDGDDANRGTSPEESFRTITHAVERLVAGGSVLVLPGTYDESIVVEGLGDPSALTTIMGIDGFPVLDGKGVSDVGISCTGCVNVDISCFEVRRFTGTGIAVSDSAAVTLADLVVTENSAHGIRIASSSDLTLEYLDLSSNGPTAPGAEPGVGIHLEDVEGLTLTAVRVHGTGGPAIEMHSSSDVLAAGNEVFENHPGDVPGAFSIVGGTAITMRDTTIRDNDGGGLALDGAADVVLEGNRSRGNVFGIRLIGAGDWDEAGVSHHSGNDFSGNTQEDVRFG